MIVFGNSPILALHGFLGLPQDWSRLGRETDSWDKRDLWADFDQLNQPESKTYLQAWAENFCREVEDADYGGGETPTRPPVLLGYSMGARLAMHAALHAPHLFQAIILISGHPGLALESERLARLKSDRAWAKRFRNDCWENLVDGWNRQPVLADANSTLPAASQPAAAHRTSKTRVALGPVRLDRNENQFDRKILAKAMEAWSLGHQEPLAEKLSQLSLPILHLVGSEDAKFRTLLSGIPLGPETRLKVIEGAGHRVPWDQPKSFLRSVEKFLE
jgi:2-succinyl-6-hydroxy-2,4-cyclohexadiene-1-carboxylate synthase